MARSSSKNSKADPASPEIKQIRERLQASFPAKEEGTDACADEAHPAAPPMADLSDAPPDAPIKASASSGDTPEQEPNPIPVPVAETNENPASEKTAGLASRLRKRLAGVFSPLSRSGGLAPALKQSVQLSPRILTASFCLNLLGLALPLAILQVYDRILPNQSYGTLTLLTTGLMIAFVLEATLKIFRSYLLGWLAVHHGFRTQVNAVRRFLIAPRSETGRHPPMLWMDAFDALGELSAFEGSPSKLVLIDIPLTSIFLLFVALIGGPLVAIPIMLILIFGALTFLKGSKLQASLTNRSEQDNKQSDFLVESLSGIHTLKGLAIEPQILRRFERLQNASALASYETMLLGNQLQSFGVLFANVMMVSIVSVGALFVMAGKLSIGGLACCSLLSGRLTQPVLRGIGMWTEIQNMQLAQERAALFDDLSESAETPVAADTQIKGTVAFDRVSFGYAGNKEASIHDITLRINAGDFIGIRGEDGSGRSTFAGLARGALEPQQGTVSIDGMPATALRSHELKHDIAYVSANTGIFRGSILDNITMFRTGEAVEAARDAARLIGLEQDIDLLPDGYNTMLGQAGSESLSSGHLQRITIARALVTRPKILIFNEANSLMDLKSDELLRNGLMHLKGQMTAILISNRPSFLNIADRVFEIKCGTLKPWRSQTAPAKASVTESAA